MTRVHLFEYFQYVIDGSGSKLIGDIFLNAGGIPFEGDGGTHI